MSTVWIATVAVPGAKKDTLPQTAVFGSRDAAHTFITDLLRLAGRPRIVSLIERPVNRESE